MWHSNVTTLLTSKSATTTLRESLISSSRKNQDKDQGNVTASSESSYSTIIVVPNNTDGQSLTLIPESLNQPVLTFPQRMFDNQQYAFCSSRYSKFSWLDYQEGTDSVFCFYCVVADRRGLPVTKNKDDAFCKVGFTNWRNLKSTKTQVPIMKR